MATSDQQEHQDQRHCLNRDCGQWYPIKSAEEEGDNPTPCPYCGWAPAWGRDQGHR
jgi:hypothetical protein